MKKIIFILLLSSILTWPLGAEISSDSAASGTPSNLIRQLGDKDALTRRKVASVLEEKGILIVPALIDALKDNNENVRYYAAFILGRISESSKEVPPIFKKAVPALIEAMNTKNELLRYGAVNALRQTGAPEAIKAIESLYDVNWHTSPSKWKESRIYHTPFDKKYANIKLEVSELPGNLKDQVFSPNMAYWYIAKLPDNLKPGPWSTVIQIYNERDYCIQLSLIDHKYLPEVSWINEKLLHIRVWWGRILGSELIFDVELEQFVYKEMIQGGTIAFEQYEQATDGRSN